MERQREHRLVVTEGPGTGHSYQLEGMITTLGRASDNTIVLDSSRISRHHAQIRVLPRGTIIEDMGSTNGTWVNDHRLTEAHGLAPGDEVRLADYITFRYDVVQPPRTGAEPPRAEPERPATTRVMQEPVPPVDEVGPAVPYRATFEEADDDVVYRPSPVDPGYVPSAERVEVEPAAPQRRPRWLYLLLGLLVVLICLCIATAVYLWFAPVEFWERVFDLFGVPMPSTLSILWVRIAV